MSWADDFPRLTADQIGRLDKLSKPTLGFPMAFLNVAAMFSHSGATVNGEPSTVWPLDARRTIRARRESPADTSVSDAPRNASVRWIFCAGTGFPPTRSARASPARPPA